MTLAQRYNRKARDIMPTVAYQLTVDDSIDSGSEIDAETWRRGEYIGGMAAVILAIVEGDG